MSTRATYQIDGVYFYIHHDGYEQGAAGYFLAMLNSLHMPLNSSGRTACGGIAEAFLRGNSQASFTTDHEQHGDTQYRYDVQQDNGSFVVSYQWRNLQTDVWTSKGSLPLGDFVNQYLPNSVVSVESGQCSGRVKLLSSDVLVALVEEDLALAQVWIDNGHSQGANYRVLIERISAYLSSLNSLVSDEPEKVDNLVSLFDGLKVK